MYVYFHLSLSLPYMNIYISVAVQDLHYNVYTYVIQRKNRDRGPPYLKHSIQSYDIHFLYG